jgi:phosphatidylglycerophosphate synthase
LLAFVAEADLDWAGFFAYSAEEGTYAADLDGVVDPSLVTERLAELRELQDGITARHRDALIGTVTEVLVDAPGVARSHREAPEIDGIVAVPDDSRGRAGQGDGARRGGPISKRPGCRRRRGHLVLRTVGPGHAGQRGDHVPAALRPLLCLLILSTGPSYGVLVLWILLASTDGFDGWLARRMGTTRSGAFLDPLADKALVLGAMWAIVADGRVLVAAGGADHRARAGHLGVPVLLGAPGAGRCPPGSGPRSRPWSSPWRWAWRWPQPIAEHQAWLASTTLWLATGLTLVTGAQYLMEGSRATATAGVRVERS